MMNRTRPTAVFRLPRRTALAALGVLLGAGLPARADSLLLRGGERLIGHLIAEEPGKVRFDSQVLGLVEIPRERVERIERDAPPPAVASSMTATTPATVVEKDSIVPAPPAVASGQAGGAVANTAVAAPTTNPAALPAKNPLTAALTPVPVFYPWSGLRTEEDTFDWIQLTSGEWLKGKIKSMYDEVLEFDSEKMDAHEFKWGDISTVRSPGLNSVRFEQAGTAAGSLLITPDEVKVVSADGTLMVPRADLLSIAPSGDKERSKWTGKVMLGLNYRSGNTEETSYNAHVALQRRTPAARLSLDYLGNFNRINGVISEENQRVTGQFDYFLSRRLYVRFPDAEYYRDPLQNIDQRTTLGGAVGYELFKTRRFEWDVSAGPAYQKTRFVSVSSGTSGTEESLAGVLSTHWKLELTKRIDWTVDYRGQRSGKNAAGGATHHANTTLEFELHKRLKLDLSFIWDRVDSPKSELSGTTPTADDYRLITSLGIDF